MERVASDGSSALRRVFGRIREEAEDILAEARSRHERSGSSTKR